MIISIVWLGNCAGMKPNPQYNESANQKKNHRQKHDNSNYEPAIASAFEEKLFERIKAHLGVPYRWGGTSKEGMDCSGFVSTVYNEALNHQLPHRARKMYDLGKWIERDELDFGDLVFFENIENAGISHVGIYIGNDRFAHASTTRGVTVSNLEEKYYRQRYVGAKRVYFSND